MGKPPEVNQKFRLGSCSVLFIERPSGELYVSLLSSVAGSCVRVMIMWARHGGFQLRTRVLCTKTPPGPEPACDSRVAAMYGTKLPAQLRSDGARDLAAFSPSRLPLAYSKPVQGSDPGTDSCNTSSMNRLDSRADPTPVLSSMHICVIFPLSMRSTTSATVRVTPHLLIMRNAMVRLSWVARMHGQAGTSAESQCKRNCHRHVPCALMAMSEHALRMPAPRPSSPRTTTEPPASVNIYVCKT